MPPQPGQSNPVVSLMTQVGTLDALESVGSVASTRAAPPAKQAATPTGPAQPGIQLTNRVTARVNRFWEGATYCG
ncbi:hypothetical protein ACFQX7_04465 [Luedemannella flava]